jgi:hypothetical protein
MAAAPLLTIDVQSARALLHSQAIDAKFQRIERDEGDILVAHVLSWDFE